MDHEQILETRPQVLEKLTALADRPHDGAEVVIQENDRRDLACAPRASLSHRDPDVGGLERGHVVDPIPCDRDDLTACLQAFHQHELLGRSAREMTSTPRSSSPFRSVTNRSSSSPVIRRGASPPMPTLFATARAVIG